MAALGRPGYITLGHQDDLERNYAVDAMRRRALDMLDHAYKLGIRYFDAARSYGRGEEFLGQWIDSRKPKNVVIGSKWGYIYTADWQVKAKKHEVKEHSIKVLEHQWRETKENIGQHLNIYQIHSATLDSKVLENQSVLDRLWELKEYGIIIGLSLSGEMQGETLKKALEIRKNDDFLFGSVQVTWNILEQSNTVILEEASEAGLGIVVKEAVSNGRLTNRNNESDFAAKKKILARMAEKYRVDIDALAMAYILHQPWASVVLSGATTVSQLESNIAALNVDFDKKDIRLLRSLKEAPKDYWQKRSDLAWN